MATEIQELPMRTFRRNSSVGSKDFEGNEIAHYTSLKDIMDHSPPRTSFCCFDGHEFDSSNITIKNELVKRAASVYLQSAASLVTKNEKCFPAFCNKVKMRAASMCSWWRLSAVYPVRACLRTILRFLNNLFRNVRSLP